MFGFDVLVPASAAGATNGASTAAAVAAGTDGTGVTGTDGAAAEGGAEQQAQQWLVVDVNYFPSFKEVCMRVYVYAMVCVMDR